MAKDAPKSLQPARPAKKASAAPKAGPKSVRPSKGRAMDDTNAPNTPTPDTSTADTPTLDLPETRPADTAPPAPATDAASSTIQSLKDSAATLTRSVGDKAKTYAEDGKARAGGALDDLAQMMHDAAGTVEEKVGAQYSQYASSAADAVSGFSEALKAKNVDDLIADATGFVRKSPAIAIGAAAAIGFVLVRLVQSGLNADTTDQS